jgi:hypothetical protein
VSAVSVVIGGPGAVPGRFARLIVLALIVLAWRVAGDRETRTGLSQARGPGDGGPVFVLGEHGIETTSQSGVIEHPC